MYDRKDFLKTLLAGTIPLGFSKFGSTNRYIGEKPVVIATWKTATKAVDAAWKVLQNNGYALDAAEAGVKVEESNPDNMTVGFGARPDREGIVTLDACVMDETGNCGSVACLENIKHPVSVARKVMTETPHAMLVGYGAKQFALSQGFEETNL